MNQQVKVRLLNVLLAIAFVMILFIVFAAAPRTAVGEETNRRTIYVGGIGPDDYQCPGRIELGYFLPNNMGTHRLNPENNDMIETAFWRTYTRFVHAFQHGPRVTDPEYDMAYDLNQDGVLTGADLNLLRDAWFKQQEKFPELFGDRFRVLLTGFTPDDTFAPRSCVVVPHYPGVGDIFEHLYQRCTVPDGRTGPWNGPVIPMTEDRYINFCAGRWENGEPTGE